MGIEAWSDFVNRFKPPGFDPLLAHQDVDLSLFMEWNGYSLSSVGEWLYDSARADKLAKKFVGTKTSFFGPEPVTHPFFVNKLKGQQFIMAFGQEPVARVIRKYNEVDQPQAGRIAYLLGGFVRQLHNKSDEEIKKVVNFASRMTLLGDERSGEAIAGSMAMYIISGGLTTENPQFTGHVYHMAEAVNNDPIKVSRTIDLGLSQVARLRGFMDRIGGIHRSFPSLDISSSMVAFDDFPTVGAEFHFPLDAPAKSPYFWKRLAVLNMSQYHPGSYIQLSRNDRDVIEIRMNPSVYPVTITNWNHMRLLLPELNQAYFTITLNRQGKDFSWNDWDRTLLNKLRSLGLISYAGVFENIPRTEKNEQVNLGNVYLGQTVRIDQGAYRFTGNWSGGEGQNGQMGIYVGFGDILPSLAYYLSMALYDPDILNANHQQISKVLSLTDALALDFRTRRHIFNSMQNKIEASPNTSRIYEAGNQIMELLNP